MHLRTARATVPVTAALVMILVACGPSPRRQSNNPGGGGGGVDNGAGAGNAAGNEGATGNEGGAAEGEGEAGAGEGTAEEPPNEGGEGGEGDEGGGGEGGAGGQGDPANVPEFGGPDPTLTTVATSRDRLSSPRDLDFHPERTGELWSINQFSEGVVIIFDAMSEDPVTESRSDAGRRHFMAGVSAIAFTEGNTFATCHEDRNDVDPNAPDFMGPTLWSADLEIFARVGQRGEDGMNGSHLDMLHQSPWCMGIAHHKDNAFWAFNGLNGHVDYYDFGVDHGPGRDDHSDGVVRRYTEVEVTRVEGVASHLQEDKDTGWVYVADTGGGRVLKFDGASGGRVEGLALHNEQLREYSRYGGVDVEVFADGLDEPSGIAVGDERIFVSLHGTGEIIAFDKDGEELGRIDTQADGLMGLTLGPNGGLWFTQTSPPAVVRIDVLR